MEPKRKLPGLVIAVAVMNLVVGLPCCGGGVIGLGVGSMQAAREVPNSPTNTGAVNPKAGFGTGNSTVATKSQQQIEDEMLVMLRKECPGYHAVSLVTAAGQTLLGLLLCAGAVGLLMGKPWGRFVTIFGAAALILLSLVKAGYTAGLVIPAQKKWFEQNANILPKEFTNIMSASLYGGICVNLLITVIYSSLAIAFLFNAKVRAYFSNRGQLGHSEEELNDDLDANGPNPTDDRWGN